jgi:hypothetical protein
LIAYHYVLEGQLSLRIDGESPCVAVAGELLVLPRNDAHLLGNNLDLRPRLAHDLIEPATDDGLARIRYGGGGMSYLLKSATSPTPRLTVLSNGNSELRRLHFVRWTIDNAPGNARIPTRT